MAVAQNSRATAKKKPRGRPFPKGVSGNPGGRPKSERAFLVERYGEDARSLHEHMDALLESDSTPAHTKVDILKFKIERHSGKAPQSLQLQGDPENPIVKIVNNYTGQDPSAPAR